jgi:sugar diacid utilization regulator
MAIPGTQSNRSPSPIELRLTRQCPDAILTARPQEIVAIIPVDLGDITTADHGRKIVRMCSAFGGQRPEICAIGIGNICESVEEIARSYAEARSALAVAKRARRPNMILAFSELGIQRLLLKMPNVNDLRSFAEDVIGPLIEEDRSAGTAYVATLSAYFGQNNSPRRAANLLHVHANTVSYRVRRAEEVTGLSFDNHRDRLMAEVAVEIVEILGSAS